MLFPTPRAISVLLFTPLGLGVGELVCTIIGCKLFHSYLGRGAVRTWLTGPCSQIPDFLFPSSPATRLHLSPFCVSSTNHLHASHRPLPIPAPRAAACALSRRDSKPAAQSRRGSTRILQWISRERLLSSLPTPANGHYSSEWYHHYLHARQHGPDNRHQDDFPAGRGRCRLCY